MILYSGGPEVAGSWKWSPVGASIVSVPTAFVSSSWDPRDSWGGETEVGEVRSSVEWTPPQETPPRLTGLTLCGTPEILAGGATAADVGTPPVDGQGIPDCCNALEWFGGSEGGGTPPNRPTQSVAGCTGVSYRLWFISTLSPFPPPLCAPRCGSGQRVSSGRAWAICFSRVKKAQTCGNLQLNRKARRLLRRGENAALKHAKSKAQLCAQQEKPEDKRND